jgi:mono/diheme cytochrome c family protein
MKLFTTIYRWLLGIGAALNFLFGLIALFSPDQLAMIVGLERMEFSYVWLGNLGMLIIPLTLMTIPAISDPVRYRVFGWLVTLGRFMMGVYWYGVAQDQANAIFAPFAGLWLTISVAQLIILLMFAEPDVRISDVNIRETVRDWKASRADLSRPLRWFSYVALAGVVFNLFWVFQSLFAQSMLKTPIGENVLFQSSTWIGITGVVLFTVTLLYIPVAAAPLRYLTYCWMIVASRLIAAVFWFAIYRMPYHSGFLAYFISDLTFGVVLFVLLQKGAPEEAKISGANVDRYLAYLAEGISMQGKTRTMRVVAAVLVAAGVFAGATSWYYFVRAVPDLEYGDDADHYKYAAIGLSAASRVPYHIYDVLPDMFPELLPDAKKGYASFGFIQEPGQPVPVGFSLREIGYKALEPNCAMCHTASIRTSPDAPPMVVTGAPAHELDLEGFQWFLYNAAASPKFTPENVMAAIQKKHNLGFMDAFVYQNVIIPAAQEAFLEQRKNYLWQLAHGRPRQGRGRTDTFNTTKLAVLKMPDDKTIGTTDLPQTWNQGRRREMWLHWDGNNNSIEQRNYAAAMAVGATPYSVRPDSFKRVTDYLWSLEAAKYPLPIDAAKAAQGRQVFQQHCADCHSWDSAKVGQVLDGEQVGTDRHRMDSFTQGLVDSFHKIAYAPFRFTAYKKQNNYSNVPLDGIWARGPYLHHGAVPTLWDLLQPPANRPKSFYRGYNVLDPVKVGFVSSGPEGFFYDTSLPGNGNGGHLYGTQLADDEKWALIEFLKTDDPLISGKHKPIPPPPAQPEVARAW